MVHHAETAGIHLGNSSKEAPMKKALLSVLILFPLLLCGCGDRAAVSRFEAFSGDLAAREALSYTAQLRAEYPDRSVEFTLAYQKGAEGEAVTVLAPERIAGIRARLQPGNAALVYEGLILDLGPLDAYGLTPMSALPRLTDTLASGAVDSHWEEDGLRVYRLILDDHLSATVWFSEAMVPVRAELASDDNVCIFCELSDWS